MSEMNQLPNLCQQQSGFKVSTSFDDPERQRDAGSSLPPWHMYGENSSIERVATVLKQWTQWIIIFNICAPIVAIVISLYAPPMINRSSILKYDFTSWNIFYLGCALFWLNAYSLYKEGRNLGRLLCDLRNYSLAIAGVQCLTQVILSIHPILNYWIYSEDLSCPLFCYATFPPLQFASTYLIPIIQLLITIDHSFSMEDSHCTPLSSKVYRIDHNLPSHVARASQEVQDVAHMVNSILEQYAPTSILSATQETLSTCSISMPIASTLAITTAMKQAMHISSCLHHLTEPNFRPQGKYSFSSLVPQIRMKNENFDISEVLQTVGDAMEGLCTKYKVPLVICFADSEWRSINIVGNQSALRHGLIHIIKTMLDAAEPGCSIEMAMNLNSPNSSYEDIKVKGGGTFIINIDISLIAKTHDPEIAVHIPLSCLVPNQIELLGASVNLLDSLVNRGPTVNIIFEAEQGSENHNSTSSSTTTLLKNELTAQEVDFQSLENFHDMLKDMKVALYALDDSIFAKHLTSCLSNWNIDITHCYINEICPSVESETKLQKDGECNQAYAQKMSLASPSPYTIPSPNNPYLSSTLKESDNDSTVATDIIIIDDDIPELKRQISNRQAAFTIDTFLRSRKSERCSKVGINGTPDVLHPDLDLPPETTILYFTSMANYKQVRDIIISNLNPWSKRSFTLSHIVAVPKPACPRRILTALYTAWNKGSIGPQYTPITTLTPSLLSSNSSFDSHATSQQYLTPSTPHSEMHFSEPRFRKHECNMDNPSLREAKSGQYFSSSSLLRPSLANSIKSYLNTRQGSPAGVIVDEGMLFVPSKRSGLQSPRSKGTINEMMLSPKGTGPISHDRHPESPIVNEVSIGYSSDQPSHSMNSYGNFIPSGDIEHAVTRTAGNAEDGDVYLVSKTSNVPPTIHSGPSSMTLTSDTLPSSNLTPEPDEKLQIVLPSPDGPHPTAHIPDDAQLQYQNHISPNGQAADNLQPPKLTGRATIRKASLKRKKKLSLNSRASVSPPIHVLIVEDNIINQVILSKWMKNHNIEYAVASDGQEAFDKWKSGGFHLILMDIQLPVMDGITVTKKIRASEKEQKNKTMPSNIPRESILSKSPDTVETLTPGPDFRSPVIIVALTASSLDSDRREALSAGCNDFLTKPVSLEWLECKITEWGCMQALIDYEGWRQWREAKRATSAVPSEEKAARKQVGKQGPSDRPGVLMRGGSTIKRV